MEKSLVIALEDFKTELAELINKSKINPYFLEPLIRDLHQELIDASRQVVQSEREIEAQRESSSDTESNNENDD